MAPVTANPTGGQGDMRACWLRWVFDEPGGGTCSVFQRNIPTLLKLFGILLDLGWISDQHPQNVLESGS